MKTKLLVLTLALGATLSAKSQNPYLPMWEYIPDAEPYVLIFGRYRLLLHGAEACGAPLATQDFPWLVCGSAPLA